MKIANNNHLGLKYKCGRTWVRYFKLNANNMFGDFIDIKKILLHYIKKNLIDYC